MRARVVTKEQATEELAAKSTHDSEMEPRKEEPKPKPYIPPKTTDRWLVNEDIYMVYHKYDDRYRIPNLKSQYHIRYGNQIDIIKLCMVYLVKIKDIMDTCQKNWP